MASDHSPTTYSRIIFDMDGVLFDTEEAVRTAYRAAGVQMPAGAYGSAWTEWLPQVCGGDMEEARRLHDLKQSIYLDMVENGEIESLPPMRLLLDHVTQSTVVTCASTDSAVALLGDYVFVREVLGVAGTTVPGKITYITNLVVGFQPHEKTVYIDDDKACGEQIVNLVNAAFPGRTPLEFIHYTGQTYAELEELIHIG